jgi:hypothetical protein
MMTDPGTASSNVDAIPLHGGWRYARAYILILPLPAGKL